MSAHYLLPHAGMPECGHIGARQPRPISKDLLAITEDLQERGVALRAVHQDFDITSANGKLAMQILGAVDEIQRNMIADNTREGLESARARGRVGGRPAGLDARRVKTAQQLKADGASIVDIAR
jgi:DNA invertase Pin-like site-specific DNA recombinase